MHQKSLTQVLKICTGGVSMGSLVEVKPTMKGGEVSLPLEYCDSSPDEEACYDGA
jgi:hypothetical protein